MEHRTRRVLQSEGIVAWIWLFKVISPSIYILLQNSLYSKNDVPPGLPYEHQQEEERPPHTLVHPCFSPQPWRSSYHNWDVTHRDQSIRSAFVRSSCPLPSITAVMQTGVFLDLLALGSYRSPWQVAFIHKCEEAMCVFAKMASLHLTQAVCGNEY